MGGNCGICGSCGIWGTWGIGGIWKSGRPAGLPPSGGGVGPPAPGALGAAKTRVYSLGPAGAEGPGPPAVGEGVVKTWVALEGGSASPPVGGKLAGGGVLAVPAEPNIWVN